MTQWKTRASTPGGSIELHDEGEWVAYTEANEVVDQLKKDLDFARARCQEALDHEYAITEKLAVKEAELQTALAYIGKMEIRREKHENQV